MVERENKLFILRKNEAIKALKAFGSFAPNWPDRRPTDVTPPTIIKPAGR